MKSLYPLSRAKVRVPRPCLRADPFPPRAIYTPHATATDVDRFDNQALPGGDSIAAGSDLTIYAICKPSEINDVVMRIISVENNPNNRSIYLALNSSNANSWRCFRNFSTTNQNIVSNANTAYLNEWQFVAFHSPGGTGTPRVFVARYEQDGRLKEIGYSTQTAGAGTSDAVGDEMCLLNRVNTPTGGNGIHGSVALVHVLTRLVSLAELQRHVYDPMPTISSWGMWLLQSANSNSVALDITGNRRHLLAQGMSTARMVKCSVPLSLFTLDDSDWGMVPAAPPPSDILGADYYHLGNPGMSFLNA